MATNTQNAYAFMEIKLHVQNYAHQGNGSKAMDMNDISYVETINKYWRDIMDYPEERKQYMWRQKINTLLQLVYLMATADAAGPDALLSIEDPPSPIMTTASQSPRPSPTTTTKKTSDETNLTKKEIEDETQQLDSIADPKRLDTWKLQNRSGRALLNTSSVRSFVYGGHRDLTFLITQRYQSFGTFVEHDAVFDSENGLNYFACKWEKDTRLKAQDLWVDCEVPNEYRYGCPGEDCTMDVWFGKQMERIRSIRARLQRKQSMDKEKETQTTPTIDTDHTNGKETTTTTTKTINAPDPKDKAKEKQDVDLIDVPAFNIKDAVDKDEDKQRRSRFRCFKYTNHMDLVLPIASLCNSYGTINTFEPAFDRKNCTYVFVKWETEISSRGMSKWTIHGSVPTEYRPNDQNSLENWSTKYIHKITSIRNSGS